MQPPRSAIGMLAEIKGIECGEAVELTHGAAHFLVLQISPEARTAAFRAFKL